MKPDTPLTPPVDLVQMLYERERRGLASFEEIIAAAVRWGYQQCEIDYRQALADPALPNWLEETDEG